MARAVFALSVVRRILARQPKNCPHCGGFDTVRLERKKCLLELRRCSSCFLMYRWPKDDLEKNQRFYQRAYRESMTTELPSRQALKTLLEANFRGTQKDFSRNIALIRHEVAAGRLLDYGASWGYGVYQFRQAGYDAVGYEISRPRAEYGRKHLDVEIMYDPAALDALEEGSFDVIHASHVLEHLPELNGAFAAFRRLLRPGGLLAIFVPNAGGASARRLGVRWLALIGEKHPLALDAVFFAKNLPLHGMEPEFRSSPYADPAISTREVDLLNALPGDELMVFARRRGQDA